MKVSQIGAQLYTLRDFLKTPADIAGSFATLHKIGYQAVQLSGLGPIEESEVVKIAKDNDLVICATHENGASILDDTDKVIEHMKKLGCTQTAYPWPHIQPMTANGVIDIAHKLNAAAEKMAKEGITLSYHNHAIEFQKRDGEIWLDLIYKNAPALCAELDTFWVQSGGQNPVDWINKMAGREPLLHLKEYGVNGNERVMRPVGDGNLDWKSIIAAGDKAGVQWFLVEQDDCGGMCPFEALARSFRYLSSLAE